MILTLTIYARNYQNKSVSLSVQAPIYKDNKERRKKNAIDHALFHKAVVN